MTTSNHKETMMPSAVT